MHDRARTLQPPSNAWTRIRLWPERLFAALLRWQQRAEERHALEALSDHILKDIGISRSDALAEARKPFWRE